SNVDHQTLSEFEQSLVRNEPESTGKAYDMTLAEIVALAPQPKTFYDHYDDDQINAIYGNWLGTAGHVFLLTHTSWPEWVNVVQTPDQGLLLSMIQRWTPVPEGFRILGSRSGSDRFKMLNGLRRRLGKIAMEKRKYTAGRGQWFRFETSAAAVATAFV